MLKDIVLELMNKNPVGVREALKEELKTRISNVLSLDEKFRPGIDVMTKTIHIDNAEDMAAVKAVKWAKFGGIEVTYKPNGDVTFKTAKMKTVAKELEKAIDFGATSAADVLDLPWELR